MSCVFVSVIGEEAQVQGKIRAAPKAIAVNSRASRVKRRVIIVIRPSCNVVDRVASPMLQSFISGLCLHP